MEAALFGSGKKNSRNDQRTARTKTIGIIDSLTNVGERGATNRSKIVQKLFLQHDRSCLQRGFKPTAGHNPACTHNRARHRQCRCRALSWVLYAGCSVPVRHAASGVYHQTLHLSTGRCIRRIPPNAASTHRTLYLPTGRYTTEIPQTRLFPLRTITHPPGTIAPYF